MPGDDKAAIGICYTPALNVREAFVYILYVYISDILGLVEPSVKRDGYAVGKDGNMYRYVLHTRGYNC